MQIKTRSILAALALLASATAAQAQGACGYIIANAKLTPAQWNFCFSQKQDALGFTTVNRAGDTMTGRLNFAPSSASTASFRVPLGSAPTVPTDGDVWTTVTGVYVRINGVTQQLVSTTGGTITNPTITGGTINNTVIGGVTPAAGTFAALSSTSGALNGTLGATTPNTATVTTLAVNGSATAAQQVVLTGRTDATIAADQNNWTPTGSGTYSQSSAVFVDGGVADRNVTGLTGGAAGRMMWLVNKGTTNSIVLKNASGSSSAANQFLLPNDTTLPPNTALELRYDGTASAWRPASRALSNTGVTAATYGDGTHVSQVAVGVDGRVTSASSVAITTNAGAIKAKINKFTSSGTYTPTANMLFVIVECVGSGGGGGGTDSSGGNNTYGGGGGGGSFSRVYATAATIGASQAVTIAAAGTAGPAAAGAGGNGGAGGDASLGTICVGKGGSGGTGATSGVSGGTGGAGGVAGTGDVTVAGQAGYPGLASTTVFFTGNGGNPGALGSGGLPAVGGAPGTTGAGFGGGGSGAGSFGASGSKTGGAGAAGVVIVTEYLSQ